jgi:hypothetical protein
MSTKIDTQSWWPAAPFTFPKGIVEITVLYNGEVVKGYVESDAMARASPVWKNFIFPPWGRQQRDVTDGNSNNGEEGRNPANATPTKKHRRKLKDDFEK